MLLGFQCFFEHPQLYLIDDEGADTQSPHAGSIYANGTYTKGTCFANAFTKGTYARGAFTGGTCVRGAFFRLLVVIQV